MSASKSQHTQHPPVAKRDRLFGWKEGLCALPLVAGLALLAYAWSPASTREPAPATAASVAVAAKPAASACVGVWRRLDGDYTLAIQSVREDGVVEATYHNPKAVHVARATLQRTPTASLEIELRDTGYDGNRYMLHHDAANDRLTGTYFQPAVQRTYQVQFARIR